MILEAFLISFHLSAAIPPEQQVFDGNRRPIVTIFGSAGQYESQIDSPDLLIAKLAGDPMLAGAASTLPLEYQATALYNDSDGTYIHYCAFVDGIRVAESEIVVVLRQDGTLQGVSGTFWP